MAPRRVQSVRKAKLSSLTAMELNEHDSLDDALVEPEEFADHEIDPAWTPDMEKSEEDLRKGRRRVTRAPGRSSLVAPPKPQLAVTPKWEGEEIVGDTLKTGDFVMSRVDLLNNNPAVWRYDPDQVLQKLEPYKHHGRIFYRNTGKYGCWNSQFKKLFIKVPVRFHFQSHTEIVVECMRTELLLSTTENLLEKIILEFSSYRDQFEIYVQTLISQVLDNNFFAEIVRENDEYFLASINAIDSIFETCKRKLLAHTNWTQTTIDIIKKSPKCHIFGDCWDQTHAMQYNCSACVKPCTLVRLLLFGPPYDAFSLQPLAADAALQNEQSEVSNLMLCEICSGLALLYHKLNHEKFQLYTICSRRVSDQQQQYPNKSTMDLLNDILAEQNWVDELFRNMRELWADVEILDYAGVYNEVLKQ